MVFLNWPTNQISRSNLGSQDAGFMIRPESSVDSAEKSLRKTVEVSFFIARVLD